MTWACPKEVSNMKIIKTEKDNIISYKIIDPSPEFIEFVKRLQEKKEEYRKQILEEYREQQDI